MKLQNCECRWAKLIEPDTRYAPKWCIDIYPPQPVLDKLEKDGFSIKTNPEGGRFVSVKQNVTSKDGKTNTAPVVVGRDGKTPFVALIGNGSIVNVLCYDYKYSGKRYLGLKAVQVVEHIPYGEAGFDALDDDEEEKDEPLFENEEY